MGLLDRWRMPPPEYQPQSAGRRNGKNTSLVEQATSNLELLSREQIIDFIDASALGGIGRNVAIFRRTGNPDQIREALMTVQVMEAGLQRLLRG